MSTSRRDFLKHSSAGLAGSALAWTGAAGANDRIVLGVIGCGGMGSNHVRHFAGYKDVQIAYVCDPDDGRAKAAAIDAEKAAGKAPKTVKDLRQVLDDRDVDAVLIATPDHWHGPAAILACQAGKHVYVEKPCSHNIREGRLMVEAARKNKRIVQTGTQSRSTEHVMKAMQLLQGGAIGEVLVAKAWNSQMRGNIGRAKPSNPPAGFDYDLWIGPTPMVPFQANRHHYTWHWWYDFGTGDMGNDGVHDIDIARWGLGVEGQPTSVAAIGGKCFFDDDQQFPDTQYVVFEYNGERGVSTPRSGEREASAPRPRKKQLIYEHRIWSPYVQEGYENGNAFYGTKGMLILGKGSGWKLFGERNKPLESMSGTFSLTPHHRNWLDCIRSGKPPHADIEIGHLSATLCHLGNIAARVGRTLRFDPQEEKLLGDEDAARLVRRTYREGHWAVPKGA